MPKVVSDLRVQHVLQYDLIEPCDYRNMWLVGGISSFHVTTLPNLVFIVNVVVEEQDSTSSPYSTATTDGTPTKNFWQFVQKQDKKKKKNRKKQQVKISKWNNKCKR